MCEDATDTPKNVILFRGDSIPHAGGASHKDHRGRTFAEHFCGNGLMAKHADLGNPRDLEGRGLVDLVLEHVGVDRGEEETYRTDHSPLLSFSTDRDTAIRFANRKAKDLETCLFEDATCFLWRFEPTLHTWRTEGAYLFLYKADPCNCRSLVAEKLERGTATLLETGDHHAFGMALMERLVHEHAVADTSTHQAFVVDVPRFLAAANLSGHDDRLVKNALHRCRRDAECLVMPADPMPDGMDFDARLQMNASLFPEAWSTGKPKPVSVPGS